MECWTIIVLGKVQGVAFRASLARFIAGFPTEVDGYARNLSNGDVEVLIRSEVSVLEKILVYCSRGPNRANVISLTLVKNSHLPHNISGFSIS